MDNEGTEANKHHGDEDGGYGCGPASVERDSFYQVVVSAGESTDKEGEKDESREKFTYQQWIARAKCGGRDSWVGPLGRWFVARDGFAVGACRT